MFISSPVIIEDEVWIGFNATILKGVIGKGAVNSARRGGVERMFRRRVLLSSNPVGTN